MIFKLNLDSNDLTVISSALSLRPYIEVAALINKINEQIIAQQECNPFEKKGGEVVE